MAKGFKRWDRSKYPANWKEISFKFRESRGFTCEACGYVQWTPLVARSGKIWRGTVDAAHRYPADTMNPNPALLCLCKRCHRRYDNSHLESLEELQHQIRMHRILLARHGYHIH